MDPMMQTLLNELFNSMNLLNRQVNAMVRHSGLSGIAGDNMLNKKMDSGQAGMTNTKRLHYLEGTIGINEK